MRERNVDGEVLAGCSFAGSYVETIDRSYVLRAHRAGGNAGRCRDSVNSVVIVEIKSLELESLILAQNERWRQA